MKVTMEKLTMEFDCNIICFIYWQISIIIGQLDTTVYNKPTDSHLCLHGKFCQKPFSNRGIQKSVALRL